MNNEIKEILDNLKDEVWSKTGADSYDKLLDYITNLQQENERLINIKKYAEDVGNKRNELYERIDKAIEELELWKPKNKVIQLEIELLLNILRGEDK